MIGIWWPSTIKKGLTLAPRLDVIIDVRQTVLLARSPTVPVPSFEQSVHEASDRAGHQHARDRVEPARHGPRIPSRREPGRERVLDMALGEQPMAPFEQKSRGDSRKKHRIVSRRQ